MTLWGTFQREKYFLMRRNIWDGLLISSLIYWLCWRLAVSFYYYWEVMDFGVERKCSWSNNTSNTIENFLQEVISGIAWQRRQIIIFWCPKWGLIRERRNILWGGNKTCKGWLKYRWKILSEVGWKRRIFQCRVFNEKGTLSSWLQLECITAKILHSIDRGRS